MLSVELENHLKKLSNDGERALLLLSHIQEKSENLHDEFQKYPADTKLPAVLKALKESLEYLDMLRVAFQGGRNTMLQGLNALKRSADPANG